MLNYKPYIYVNDDGDSILMTHIHNAEDMRKTNLTSDIHDCDIQRNMSKEENF